MPSAYQSFVGGTLKKAPAHMAQNDKMRWVAEQWRSRKQGKGTEPPPAKIAKSAKMERWARIPSTLTEEEKDYPLPAPKPAKKKATPNKSKKPAGGKGLVAPGAKRAGGKGLATKAGFKDTARIANIASRAGIIDNVLKSATPAEIASGKILGATHTNRPRKGANLISIKSHH